MIRNDLPTVTSDLNHEKVINQVRNWVEKFVVDLNLCPFAKRELAKERVRFCVSEAVNEDQLLADLLRELDTLTGNDSIETTVLIHPRVLQEFHSYNQFLNIADFLLEQADLQGIYQIASFHPHYQFSGTTPEDAENYTNRSPFPMLHLLREDSLSRALDSYADADLIPAKNIERLQSLGVKKLQELLGQCAE